MQEFDELDQKILAILQQNARTPISKIAKQINRSRTAVQARLHKLETKGVILGYRVELASTQKASEALVTVYMYDRLEQHSVVEALKRFPEVSRCYRISGDADLLVELAQASHERIQYICKQLWNHENVRLTETVFILEPLI